MKHLFAINCHRDQEQLLRLLAVLQDHRGFSEIFVYMDGPDCDEGTLQRVREGCDSLTLNPFEPSKARGIISATNGAYMHALHVGADILTLLHPDIVPTDRGRFREFLARFQASGKALACAPIFPGSNVPNWCSLHFRVPLCSRLFPIGLPLPGAGAGNEQIAAASWHHTWPEWRDHVYPTWMLVMPFTGQVTVQDQRLAKRGHDWRGEWQVHDYTPETTMIHTDDPRFWERVNDIVR